MFITYTATYTATYNNIHINIYSNIYHTVWYSFSKTCDSRYCFLYQRIIVTVTARMLFGTDAHVLWFT